MDYRIVTKYSDEEQCWISRVMDYAEHPELNGIEARGASAADAEDAARVEIGSKLFPRARIATGRCAYCGLVEEHSPECRRGT